MRRTVLIAIGGLVAFAALFAACGGDSGPSGTSGPGDTSQPQANNIRVSKGLTVANVGGQRSAGGEELSAGAPVPAPAAADSRALPATGGYSGGGGSAGNQAAPQVTDATDNTGITVQGYGSATADADSAIVEFSFSSNGCCGPTPPIYYGEDTKPTPSAGAQVTRETLQPVIVALVAAGVADSDIELLGQTYYYDAYSSYGTLRATIHDVAAVDAAVQAAQGAAGGLGGIYLQSTNISYALNDCSAIEKAATQAAVEDAADRAGILADVLNVMLGPVAGASDYSWYQWGTGCGSDYGTPYPLAYNAWRAGGTGEGMVQVVSNISVTYSFQ